jgi:hypothetical protein
VKKQLGLLRSMFQIALEDEKFGLKSNPGADVKVRGEVGKVKERAAFSAEELQRIFSAPVFMRGERPQGGAGEAAYWIPLIGRAGLRGGRCPVERAKNAAERVAAREALDVEVSI